MPADKVLIDSNCLHKLYLRSLLLSLADAGLLQPRWSREIIVETIRSVNRRFPQRSTSVRARLRSLSRYFPGSLVSGYSHLSGDLGCKDQADEHVLAAAIHSRSEVLLTFNTVDFPKDSFERFAVKVIHPDMYLLQLAIRYETQFSQACSEWLKHFKKPALRAEEGAQALLLAGCRELSQWLDERSKTINELLLETRTKESLGLRDV